VLASGKSFPRLCQSEIQKREFNQTNLANQMVNFKDAFSTSLVVKPEAVFLRLQESKKNEVW